MNAQLARLPEWFEYFGSLIRTHEGTVPPFLGTNQILRVYHQLMELSLGSYVNYVKRVPLGVCGLLTPWNHPLLIAIKKIAPALACGNSVVLKPSEMAPVSIIEFASLVCADAGLPAGVLNIMPGLGPSTGKAICSHPRIRYFLRVSVPYLFMCMGVIRLNCISVQKS
jgi:acyl-CoA reductase-like NAD-dependent aldehyde dehydrogenase